MNIEFDKLVNINGITYNLITSFKLGYKKLWSSDTGRSIETGKMSGTMKGVFPQVECLFDISTDGMTQEDFNSLIDSALYDQNIVLKFWNIKTGSIKEMICYCADVDFEIKSYGSIEPFTLTFTANESVKV